MGVLLVFAVTLMLGGCATMQSRSPVVSILVDLDSASLTPEGHVHDAANNSSQGSLEFPATLVIVGNAANFDTPRRDNLDANGKSALDGIGVSIVQITP